MTRRYSRASRLTAPKAASETPDIAADGYWIDAEQFFFLAERMDSTIGRLIVVPSLVDMRTREVKEVIALRTLARLISNHASNAIGVEALADAEFDMPEAGTLAVSVSGHDYVIGLSGPAVLRASPALADAGLYSPDGRHACFVKGHDLWIKDRETGIERALTTDGLAHFGYGQESESCLRPLSYRRRPYPAALWSPDSQWVLTHRIDERALPELALIQHAPPGGGRPQVHRYKYPFPGDPLPCATFLAIHVASGRIVAFDDLPVAVAAFSPFFMRMVWFAEPHIAWLVRLDRYCRQCELVRLDLAQGTHRVVLTDSTTNGYLDLNPVLGRTPNVRVLPRSNELIWFSEQDGWGHLFLHDAQTGALKNPITRGAWLVRDLIYVDEVQRRVVFLAGGMNPQTDPAHRALCVVNLDGSGLTVLRHHDGDLAMPRTEPCGLGQDRPARRPTFSPGISPGGHYGVLRYLSVDRGNRLDIVHLREQQDFTIARGLSDPTHSVRRFTALAADGVTRLHGVLFMPPDFNPERRFALIDYIYPGPQKAQQPQSYRALSAAQAIALAELGFITLMLDTRGMPAGSRAFHHAGYGALLEPQLADHAAVVRQLCVHHRFIDSDRIGMLGWSGGGYATARALCDYGDLFKVGVAACGNHDPNAYAAFWSEKYRGPGAPEDFAAQANATVAVKLTGKLLLITGDMDDNVHPAHTMSLVDALIRANKDFDLLLVPNEDHYVLTTSGYAQRKAWDYFVTHLLHETPPREFELRFAPEELARFHKSFWREVRQ